MNNMFKPHGSMSLEELLLHALEFGVDLPVIELAICEAMAFVAKFSHESDRDAVETAVQLGREWANGAPRFLSAAEKALKDQKRVLERIFEHRERVFKTVRADYFAGNATADAWFQAQGAHQSVVAVYAGLSVLCGDRQFVRLHAWWFAAECAACVGPAIRSGPGVLPERHNSRQLSLELVQSCSNVLTSEQMALAEIRIVALGSRWLDKGIYQHFQQLVDSGGLAALMSEWQSVRDSSEDGKEKWLGRRCKMLADRLHAEHCGGRSSRCLCDAPPQ